MNRHEILAAAKAAPAKLSLEEYREAVEELRQKGFSWREVADFLIANGVQTDHTQVYRAFAGESKQRRTESRGIEINRAVYVGERKTKRGKTWDVLEFELPSKLGQPISVLGYAWGSGAAQFKIGPDRTLELRNVRLVTKSGSSFPMAFIRAEFLAEGGYWSPREVYILPNWDALL